MFQKRCTMLVQADADAQKAEERCNDDVFSMKGHVCSAVLQEDDSRRLKPIRFKKRHIPEPK